MESGLSNHVDTRHHAAVALDVQPDVCIRSLALGMRLELEGRRIAVAGDNLAVGKAVFRHGKRDNR